jgi:N-acetylmuramoyl-L-alanine amidase
MKIQKALLTKNIFSRPGIKLEGLNGIVMHWVANPGTSAMANRNYFENLSKQSPSDAAARYASAHFIIGIEGDIVQCLPTSEMAYHVGAKKYTAQAITALGHIPNNRTIGIELCHPDASGKFTNATLESAQGLCETLCLEFKLAPLDRIWTHHQITGKDCPKWFVNNPDDFFEFKSRVMEAVWQK